MGLWVSDCSGPGLQHFRACGSASQQHGADGCTPWQPTSECFTATDGGALITGVQEDPGRPSKLETKGRGRNKFGRLKFETVSVVPAPRLERCYTMLFTKSPFHCDVDPRIAESFCSG